MSNANDEEPPPKSTDLDGWRRAIADGSHRNFRLEEFVAAIQDLGPCADKAVLNPLAKHLSDVLTGILRAHVSVYHPNRGNDIIARAFGRIIDAVLKKTSADGKALRVAFFPRVRYRIKDALAAEARAARTSSDNSAGNSPADAAQTPSTDPTHSASLYDPVSAIDEGIDVESILQKIPDDQKRLAFRLHMDGVPFKSKKSHSIAVALNISEKTAREWVSEVRELLSPISEIQELRKSKTRGTP